MVTTVVCVVQMTHAGTVAVVLVSASMHHRLPNKVEFIEPPQIQDVVLKKVRSSLDIKVTGRHFWHGHILCAVNARTAKGSFHSSTAVLCSSPAFKSKQIEIVISIDAISSASFSVLDVYPTFKLSYVYPAEGYADTPHTVSIVGDGFDILEVWLCKLAGFILVPATRISDKELNCTIPKMPLQNISIQVMNSDRSTSTNLLEHRLVKANRSRFEPLPVSTGVPLARFQGAKFTLKPSSGMHGQAQIVTVQGAGFSRHGNFQCGVQGHAFSPTRWQSAFALTCRLPSHDPGNVTVTLIDSSGKSVGTHLFWYVLFDVLMISIRFHIVINSCDYAF